MDGHFNLYRELMEEFKGKEIAFKQPKPGDPTYSDEQKTTMETKIMVIQAKIRNHYDRLRAAHAGPSGEGNLKKRKRKKKGK